MWYVCDVLNEGLYIRVSCFVVRVCAVSKSFVAVCNCDLRSVFNMYLDNLKFCVVCINGRRNVCCSECNVASIGVKLCTLVFFLSKLGFLNCDAISMCVVNKLFELLEFVFDFVYVDLQYKEISLTFIAGSVCLCNACGHVVVFGLSVMLS